MSRLIVVCIVLSACGPALPSERGHPASAHEPQAPVPALATALTGDPAPPPDDVPAAARAYATDDDRGVRPPVLGVQQSMGGAPPPSRDTTTGAAQTHRHASTTGTGQPESPHARHGAPAE